MHKTVAQMVSEIQKNVALQHSDDAAVCSAVALHVSAFNTFVKWGRKLCYPQPILI